MRHEKTLIRKKKLMRTLIQVKHIYNSSNYWLVLSGASLVTWLISENSYAMVFFLYLLCFLLPYFLWTNEDNVDSVSASSIFFFYGCAFLIDFLLLFFFWSVIAYEPNTFKEILGVLWFDAGLPKGLSILILLPFIIHVDSAIQFSKIVEPIK